MGNHETSWMSWIRAMGLGSTCSMELRLGDGLARVVSTLRTIGLDRWVSHGIFGIEYFCDEAKMDLDPMKDLQSAIDY